MGIKAAEEHYKWRVVVGHPDRASNWTHGSDLLWVPVGNGCLVHPRIVLTSLSAAKSAENNRYGYTPSVRPKVESIATGVADEICRPHYASREEPEYKCKIGYADEERDLAALILAKTFQNSGGGEFAKFPEVADVPPEPGQTLCLLTEQLLTSPNHARHGHYICFNYGSVCLLRAKNQVLFALSGVLTEDNYAGAAVFDESGKIYGVVTDYLKKLVVPPYDVANSGCFVVFSPVYKSASQILSLPPSEPMEPSGRE